MSRSTAPADEPVSSRGVAVGIAAAAAYAVLSYGLMVSSADRAGVLLAWMAMPWGLSLWAATRRRQWPTSAGLIALGLAALQIADHGGAADVQRLYVLEHAGIHLLLCAHFALTLRPGQLSLVGGIAQRVHGSLNDDLVAYCQRVTLIWVVYFLTMSLLSVWVYQAGSWRAWSMLANLITPVAIALLFVGEHALRYRLHPEFERASLMDAARAYSRPVPR